MKGFEPVMLAAITRQIPWHGQTSRSRIRAVERNGVVNIADGRGAITAREPARHVATPDPTFQRRRRLIAQSLRRADCRAVNQPQRSRLRELTHLLGVDHPVALQIAGLVAVPGDRLLTGDHVDHRSHLAGSRLGFGGAGGTISPTAVAAEDTTLKERRQRIRAALSDGAG